MAGDWIKLESVTADKPEVYTIAAELGMPTEQALGHLIRIWVWADQQSLDGRLVRTTLSSIDAVARTTGFAKAMQKAGWLVGQDGKITFPNFELHNGKSAKRRAQKTKQKQDERSSTEDDKRTTREEKSLKPINTPPSSITDDKKGRRQNGQGPMRQGWAPSDATRERLGKELKLSVTELDRYVLWFIDYCGSNGKAYKNFEQAFSNCVRSDWPRYRGRAVPAVDPMKLSI